MQFQAPLSPSETTTTFPVAAEGLKDKQGRKGYLGCLIWEMDVFLAPPRLNRQPGGSLSLFVGCISPFPKVRPTARTSLWLQLRWGQAIRVGPDCPEDDRHPRRSPGLGWLCSEPLTRPALPYGLSLGPGAGCMRARWVRACVFARPLEPV